MAHRIPALGIRIKHVNDSILTETQIREYFSKFGNIRWIKKDFGNRYILDSVRSECEYYKVDGTETNYNVYFSTDDIAKTLSKQKHTINGYVLETEWVRVQYGSPFENDPDLY